MHLAMKHQTLRETLRRVQSESLTKKTTPRLGINLFIRLIRERNIKTD